MLLLIVEQCWLFVGAADETIVILVSLGVGAVVVIVIVITVGVLVYNKRNRFVTLLPD